MWRCLVTDQKSWNYSTLVHEHREICCKSAKHPHTLDVLTCHATWIQQPRDRVPTISNLKAHQGEHCELIPYETDGYLWLCTIHCMENGRLSRRDWRAKKCFKKKLLLSGMLFDKNLKHLELLACTARPSRFSCLINHTCHKVNQCPIKVHTGLSFGFHYPPRGIIEIAPQIAWILRANTEL